MKNYLHGMTLLMKQRTLRDDLLCIRLRRGGTAHLLNTTYSKQKEIGEYQHEKDDIDTDESDQSEMLGLLLWNCWRGTLMRNRGLLTASLPHGQTTRTGYIQHNEDTICIEKCNADTE